MPLRSRCRCSTGNSRPAICNLCDALRLELVESLGVRKLFLGPATATFAASASAIDGALAFRLLTFTYGVDARVNREVLVEVAGMLRFKLMLLLSSREDTKNTDLRLR